MEDPAESSVSTDATILWLGDAPTAGATHGPPPSPFLIKADRISGSVDTAAIAVLTAMTDDPEPVD